MTNTQFDFDIEAPPPMSQFDPKSREYHPDNASLLAMERARYARIMNKQDLTRARADLKRVQSALDAHNVDKFLDEKQRLLMELGKLKMQFDKLQEKLNLESADIETLNKKCDIVRENARQVKQELSIVSKRIAPHRKTIQRRDEIKSRIDEHITAIQDAKQAEIDKREMEKEANIHASLIIKTWNRLGYCYEVSVRGKMRRRSVRFERIVVTPDEIQFKIDVSQLGLLDNTVHNLPSGVRAFDLVKPETLVELSVACERQIVSPNIDNETDWKQGAWLRQFRLNFHDGLMEKVFYPQVIKRYNSDNHHLFPLPLGVRAGRHINWVNLVDHPHLMINGQTGSGKTNAIRMILTTLIEKHSPDDVRFVLIDLKRGGDLNPFANTPHAIGNVVKSVDDVATVMAQMEMLMRRRMDIISRVTNDIVDYNQIVEPENRMPRIILVFDEYGAIKSGSKESSQQIEHSAIQLATQARASGIQMIIGTQQPYSDSVHKQIKANITLVLVGRQRTAGASISTIGTAEATKIPKIAGRMMCEDGSNQYQVQLPFVSKDDIWNAVAGCSKWDSPRPLHLPSSDGNDTQPIEPVKVFDERTVIEYAFTHFEGILNGRNIWEMLKNNGVSRSMVMSAIENIVQKGSVEWQNQEYIVKPEKKYHRLKPINPKTSVESTGV